MILHERLFPNPLLAMAFKDGIEYVSDPDMRARNPERLKDGSGNWKVVIEDSNDYDDGEDENDTSSEPDKVSFQEFQRLTKANMKPETPKFEPSVSSQKPDMRPVTPKREPLITQSATEVLAQSHLRLVPRQSKARTIIDVGEEMDKPAIKPCGDCINCKLGDECVFILEQTCEVMPGRER